MAVLPESHLVWVWNKHGESLLLGAGFLNCKSEPVFFLPLVYEGQHADTDLVPLRL